MENRSSLTYIDLFAGCGGLSLGLHNAGWKGVFAVEKSPDAFATLKHNLIDKKNHFDWPEWLKKKGAPTPLDIITVIKNFEKELKALRGTIDMVTGGPPCQGFSSNGRRRENDKRNKLIDVYLEFIELVQPKVLFFENVKGFTMEFVKNKSKGEKYSSYVVEKLTTLGYDVQGNIVDFSQYGVPQKRNRFILVGFRKDVLKEKEKADVFFKKIDTNKNEFLVNKNLQINTSLEEAISDLLMKHGTEISPDTKRFKAGIYSVALSPYQKYLRNGIHKGKIADSHRFVNHSAEVVTRFKKFLAEERRNVTISDKAKLEFGLHKRTQVPLSPSLPAPTITTLPDDYIHYLEPRILTVREYARIQSFPDDYEFKGKYTTGGKRRVQEVPRYTQIGNAIPPLFGEQSGLAIKKIMTDD
jgi:DNA (cytosine-5)-methyltransferase 1